MMVNSFAYPSMTLILMDLRMKIRQMEGLGGGGGGAGNFTKQINFVPFTPLINHSEQDLGCEIFAIF
jgi:hypothetical protein